MAVIRDLRNRLDGVIGVRELVALFWQCFVFNSSVRSWCLLFGGYCYSVALVAQVFADRYGYCCRVLCFFAVLFLVRGWVLWEG